MTDNDKILRYFKKCYLGKLSLLNRDTDKSYNCPEFDEFIYNHSIEDQNMIFGFAFKYGYMLYHAYDYYDDSNKHFSDMFVKLMQMPDENFTYQTIKALYELTKYEEFMKSMDEKYSTNMFDQFNKIYEGELNGNN